MPMARALFANGGGNHPDHGPAGCQPAAGVVHFGDIGQAVVQILVVCVYFRGSNRGPNQRGGIFAVVVCRAAKNFFISLGLAFWAVGFGHG